jgi:hypothetical protein
MKNSGICFFVLLATLVAGCKSGSDTGQPGANLAPRPAPSPTLTDAQAKRLAIIDGQAVLAGDIQRALLEVGGAIALEELVIDVALQSMARQEGVTVDPAAVDRERLALLVTVAQGADLSAEQAMGLVERFRRARGLGPARFEALLKRNGLLRAMVAGEVAVTETEVQDAVAAAMGPRVLARIVVTPSFSMASAAAERVRAAGGLETRRATMALIAGSDSIDASAARGGQIGPLSPSDPALVSTLRGALSLPVGEVSDVFAIEGSFAVLLVEERLSAPSNPAMSDPVRLRAGIRQRKEREAMDRLAGQLLSQARVIVTDESLRWAWESRPGG